MKKNIISIFVVLLTLLHAEREFVLYPECLEEVSEKYSKIHLVQHFQDYSKAYDNAEWSTMPIDPHKLYYHKVDIKKYEEFNRIGLDLQKLNLQNNVQRNKIETSLFCHLVFVGKVLKEEEIKDICKIIKKGFDVVQSIHPLIQFFGGCFFIG